MSKAVRHIATALAATFILQACGGGGDGSPNPGPSAPQTPPATVTSVTVTSSTTKLTAIGATANLSASLTMSSGSPTSPTVQWSSSNPSVATVAGAGVNATVTAVASGTVIITATSGDKSGAASITVEIPPTITSVTVAPTTQTLTAAGATVTLTATVMTSSGIATSPTVAWISSNPAVATVTGSGTNGNGINATVTAVSNGSTTISATSADRSGTATITVNLPVVVPVASITISKAPDYMLTSETAQLTAVTRAADGTVLTGRPISWSTSSSLSATVSTSGLVTAIAPYDSVRITATSEGKSATTATIVYATPLRRVTSFGANPGNIALWEGGPTVNATHPLVLVLHGCNMRATQMEFSGWTELAHRHGFTVLYPESTGSQCFHFYDSLHTRRGRGHAASLANAVTWAVQNRNVDPSRVYITGFSGGGFMSANMIASYPEMFAAASILEGGPARCADDPLVQAATAVCNVSIDRTPTEWGDLVRNMSGHPGAPYPRVSIWHGDLDGTVALQSSVELMEQWTNLHGIDQTADVTTTIGPATRYQFRDAQGVTKVEGWIISGLGHSMPVLSTQKCGYNIPPWSIDFGVCYTEWSARFFGLVP